VQIPQNTNARRCSGRLTERLVKWSAENPQHCIPQLRYQRVSPYYSTQQSSAFAADNPLPLKQLQPSTLTTKETTSTKKQPSPSETVATFNTHNKGNNKHKETTLSL
jgi:hypothetical protein